MHSNTPCGHWDLPAVNHICRFRAGLSNTGLVRKGLMEGGGYLTSASLLPVQAPVQLPQISTVLVHFFLSLLLMDEACWLANCVGRWDHHISQPSYRLTCSSLLLAETVTVTNGFLSACIRSKHTHMLCCSGRCIKFGVHVIYTFIRRTLLRVVMCLFNL